MAWRNRRAALTHRAVQHGAAAFTYSAAGAVVASRSAWGRGLHGDDNAGLVFGIFLVFVVSVLAIVGIVSRRRPPRPPISTALPKHFDVAQDKPPTRHFIQTPHEVSTLPIDKPKRVRPNADLPTIASRIRLPLLIKYRDAKGTVTDRPVTAMRVIGAPQPDGSVRPTHFYAFCEKRNGVRSFAFRRVVEAIDGETGEVVPDLARHLLDAAAENEAKRNNS